MIFILHYILFNAGLSATLILLTLFLQTYSNASLTQIGALLMVLPFLSIVVKPVICALADRHQAHKQYLTSSLALMALGYGSLAVAPFFPDFREQNGNLIWYLDIVGIVIGFSAFGVVWSLGDALAVNAARLKGIPWGSYRVWATISWGVFGLIVGQINETPVLPKYVPAFLVLVGSLLLEILLLAVWPDKYFNMVELADTQQTADGLPTNYLEDSMLSQPKTKQCDDLEMNESWQATAGNRSLTGTLSGSARLNPRLMGAMANVFLEDIGSSLKSSLKLGPPQKRMALAEMLEQHQLISGSNPPVGATGDTLPAAPPPTTTVHGSPTSAPAQHNGSPSITNVSLATSHLANGSQGGSGSGASGTMSKATTIGRAALRRTQMALSRMNSLSSATGHAIFQNLPNDEQLATILQQHAQNNQQHQHMMIMSSLVSNASLSRATAARALGFGPSSFGLKDSGSLQNVGKDLSIGESGTLTRNNNNNNSKPEEDLQLVLFKLIIKRKSILRYLIFFTLFGILFTIHLVYFFLYVELLCHQKGYNFSNVMGAMVAAQSISEVFSFLVIVPYFMPRVGRLGSMISCTLVFAIRYAFYGTYYSELSPYTAIITETCHGFAYGITYTLITDIATECVNQVDVYLPELIQRRIVDPKIDPNKLKLPLRATMQGVFSGAFDGLGNGIGALFAGIYLDAYSHTSLWLLCTYVSLALAVLYPLTEWRSLCGRPKS